MRYKDASSLRVLPTRVLICPFRSFASSAHQQQDVMEDAHASSAPPTGPISATGTSKAKQQLNLPDVDPNTVVTRRDERIAMRSGTPPIGSRRRRAAIQASANIPFEHLPYQCFQEARKVLLEDRKEKVTQVASQRARIVRLKESDVGVMQGKQLKQKRMESMQKHLEHLKILADVNDPLVKKRYEDGLGDMSRPIYRYYAERKWRAQRHLILMQRINQMNVVPDLLPNLDMTVDMDLQFGRHTIKPGEKVPSLLSETPPRITIQPFDKGERLMTVAVIDPDVPNAETNGFDMRTHFLASNIPISPTNSGLRLSSYAHGETEDSKKQLIQNWVPPTAEQGAPYHRLCIVAMEQPNNEVIDVAEAKNQNMQSWSIRKFMSMRKFQPVGIFLFRTVWDEHMDTLMHKLGIDSTKVQYKHRRVAPLPYKKKPSDGERYR